MKEQILDFKKGSTIIFTRGEYSDYQYDGPFVALCDFNIRKALDLIFKDAWAACKDRMHPFAEMEKLGFNYCYSLQEGDHTDARLEEFLEAGDIPSILCRFKYIKPIDHHSFHLGEYSNLSF